MLSAFDIPAVMPCQVLIAFFSMSGFHKILLYDAIMFYIVKYLQKRLTLTASPCTLFGNSSIMI